MQKIIITAFVAFCAIIIGLTVGLYVKSGLDSRAILEASIKDHLNSVISTADDYIDVTAMEKYSNINAFFKDGNASVHMEMDEKAREYVYTRNLEVYTDEYKQTVEKLREICKESNATYVYTVMRVGEKYYIIYDSDEEFKPFYLYAENTAGLPCDAFRDAFAGEASAGVRNLDDEWGSFNSAARPLSDNSIICVDIRDAFLEQSIFQFYMYLIIIIFSMAVMLAIFGWSLGYLLRNIKKAQDQLKLMANYDKLTDLPNRRYLMDQLDDMSTKKDRPFALYFIDLDNFKKVNDNAGHDAGDELLRHIAIYLQNARDSSDVFRLTAGQVNVTARIGGDEFIIIIPDIETEEAAAQFAQELIDGFNTQHVDKNAALYKVGLSIGVALYPKHVNDHKTIINYADIAMYYAKKSGKNNYRVYNDSMNMEESNKLGANDRV